MINVKKYCFRNRKIPVPVRKLDCCPLCSPRSEQVHKLQGHKTDRTKSYIATFETVCWVRGGNPSDPSGETPPTARKK